jgi:hypothetical protein
MCVMEEVVIIPARRPLRQGTSKVARGKPSLGARQRLVMMRRWLATALSPTGPQPRPRACANISRYDHDRQAVPQIKIGPGFLCAGAEGYACAEIYGSYATAPGRRGQGVPARGVVVMP